MGNDDNISTIDGFLSSNNDIPFPCRLQEHSASFRLMHMCDTHGQQTCEISLIEMHANTDLLAQFKSYISTIAIF
jgi:hypothetical protein